MLQESMTRSIATRRTDSSPVPNTSTRRWSVAIALLCMLGASGCDQDDRRPPKSAPATTSWEHSAAPAETAKSIWVPQPDSPSNQLEETWDAVFMGSTKVGSIHSVFESLRQDEQEMIKASSVSQIELSRFGQTTQMQTELVSTTTAEGALRWFTMTSSVGPTPLVIEGEVIDDALQLTTQNQGKRADDTLAWDASWGGFFALERSLSTAPMQAGEKRQLRSLMPGVTGVQPVTTQLAAQAVESVELLDAKKRNLLRIEMQNEIGNQQLDSICWVTNEGEIMKTEIPALQQTIYRTSQARALAPGQGDYDLGRDSIVRVSTPLPHPHELTRATYQVTLPGKDLGRVFASGGSQRVESTGPGAARITVFAVRPDRPLGGAKDAPPGPDDVQPNSLIQSDNQRVITMARGLVSEGTDTWTKCLALEKGVHAAIDQKNFGQGFATAADVAQRLEGDCTEHAVLLAALCRAQEIPARVALGLVYSPRDQGFAFHMWNEAWVKDRWIPLDATLGRGGIGAAHIKLTDSALQRQAAEEAILSVLQVINQLEMEVVDYQPQ